MGVQPSIRQIDKYQVLEVLGQGGMGIVYRAVDISIGRTVAIKMLKGPGVDEPELLERFYREAKSTANLQHKNIVTVYSLGHQDGNPYIVMEYLDGAPASVIISSRRSVPLVDKLDLVVQVCEALQYAHERNLIHRDIKPANVMVLKDGTVKIVDFGIARIGGSQTLTQAGQLIGSPWYMSPEQINSLPLDSRTDIFSTGVLLYELLAYALPFKGDDTTSTFMKILREEPPPLAKYLREYPPELDDILRRALAKNVDERYQSAEELGFDLSQIHKNVKRGLAAELVQRAEAAVSRGDLERAKIDLQEVLKFDRQNDVANNLLRQVRQAIQQQQRAAQVMQMRSQAQVALAGEQYEEALACAEQAVRLSPEDQESIRLREEIRDIISRTKAVHEALRRAESAVFAGDFDDAKNAVDEALRFNPNDSEARALLSVVEKELAERSRRLKVQSFVDSARREISERQFAVAIDSLLEAEKLDPADSNVRELLQWAQRGQEQEQRKKDLREISSQIDGALRAEDFASACTICEMGLGRFPDEPSLIKLKTIAERQRETKQRRDFVQEQSILVRSLVAQGDHEGAVRMLTSALRKYPAEANLEKLLAFTTAELERRNSERDAIAKREASQRNEIQARSRSHQQILDCAASLRRALDLGQGIDASLQLASGLQDLMQTAAVDQHILSICDPLLKEFKKRLGARDQAVVELEQLRRAADNSPNAVARGQAGERAQAIKVAFANEPSITLKCEEIADALHRRDDQRELLVNDLTRIANSVLVAAPNEIQGLLDEAAKVAATSIGDPQVGALFQQVQYEATRRLESCKKALQALGLLCSKIQSVQSIAELSALLEQAEALASSEASDPDIERTLVKLRVLADARRRSFESVLRDVLVINDKIINAPTIDSAETVFNEAETIAASHPDHLDVQEAIARLSVQVRGRRVEHDLICHELISLSAAVTLASSPEEIEGIQGRVAECRNKHPNDPEIAALCEQILAVVRKTQTPSSGVSSSSIDMSAEANSSATKLFGSVVEDVRLRVDSSPVMTKLDGPDTAESIHGRSKRPMVATAVLLAALSLGFVLWRLLRHPPTPSPLRIEVTTLPEGASVRIKDSKQECVTPNCTFSLPPGNYELEARLEDYQDEAKPISVGTGRPQSVKIEMRKLVPRAEAESKVETKGGDEVSLPQPTRLQINNAPPGAEVIIDGTKVGRTNRAGAFSLEVTPGNHQIKLLAGKQETGVLFQRFSVGATTVINGSEIRPSPPVQAGEQVEWQQVKNTGTVKDLDNFLLRYPNGVFRQEAENRREDLYWLKANNDGTASALSDYLKRYRDGKYSDQATHELAGLEWKSIESSKDTNRIENFLKAHNSGEFHDRAIHALDELMWDGTRGDSTAIRLYLQKFPNGAHADQARNQLNQSTKPKEGGETASVAVPKAPVANPVSTVDETSAVLLIPKEYQRAYEDRNVDELKAIWPGLTPDQQQHLRELLNPARSVKLDYTVTSGPTISGDNATVGLSVHLLIDGKSPIGGTSKLTMRLKRMIVQGNQERWQIESIK